MSIGHAIGLNLVGIFALAVLIGLLAPERARALVALWVAFVLADLSFVGWIVYVAVHFVSKYW